MTGDSAKTPESGGTLGLVVQDRYELLRRLAVGGMGEIYLARQTGIIGADRLVTIKTLLPHLAARPESLQDFIDEARLVSRLNHPGIVSILEVGKWRGVHFIAMEYVHGRSLSNMWSTAARARTAIPLVVGAEVVRSMALALDHAHHARDATTGREASIVHRDVSPHNIMVRFDGLSKLLDFGIAKSASDEKEKTQSGLIKGKIAYMAPEQLLGRPVTAALDQFALGIILWEFSTGRRLLSGSDPLANMRKMFDGVLARPASIRSTLPRVLDDIIMRMLAIDPAHRYPSCGEAARALHSFLMSACDGREATSIVQEFLTKLFEKEARTPVDLTPVPVTIHGLDPDLIVCQFCNQKVPSSSPYCSSCGQPIRAAVKSPPPPPPESTLREHPGPRHQRPQTTRSGVFRKTNTSVPIIGRDGELAGARAIVAKATQGKGSAALFIGPHGSGRSRLLDAIAGIASLEGHTVASTRGHPRGDNMWCRVFEALSTGIVGESATAIVGHNCLPVLASLPGCEEHIDDIGAPFFERDPQMDPALLARLFDTYLEASGASSISVIIDDVDWLRANERQTLLGLIPWMSSTRFTVLAAGLPGESDFSSLRRITLEPMAPRDIHKLAELTLRGVLPKTVRELLSQAHGLPSNVGVVLGTLAQTGALVQVEKEWLVFPAAVSDTELPLWSDHITDALSELSPRAQDILREVGERSQPTKRAEFKSAGDMTAIEELLSVGLLRQDLDGRRVEAAGSSVVERLFSKEDFDIEIAELLPAATP